MQSADRDHFFETEYVYNFDIKYISILTILAVLFKLNVNARPQRPAIKMANQLL